MNLETDDIQKKLKKEEENNNPLVPSDSEEKTIPLQFHSL
jgi:hypothetical protein